VGNFKFPFVKGELPPLKKRFSLRRGGGCKRGFGDKRGIFKDKGRF